MGINQKLLKSILLSSLILWTIPTFATIYEDAEDNTTTSWRISGDTTDATIENVFDIERGSQVIKLTGNGKKTGYRIGNRSGRASYIGAWHNGTEKKLQWSMKYDEPFRIYIPITTEHGNRYLTYTNQSVDAKGKIRGGKVNHGLGEDSIDGTWHTFTRDLEADWNEFMPNNHFVSVNGFFIKGSGYIDDIMSINDSNPNIPKVDTAKPIITLLGDATVTLTIDTTYTDAGATAIDNVDGNITSNIQVTGLPIDTSSEGNYTITYSVSDTAGNVADVVTRSVTVENGCEHSTAITRSELLDMIANREDISGVNTCAITDMSYLFNSALEEDYPQGYLNLNGWDVSNVTNMEGMFQGVGCEENCSEWGVIIIDKWDVSKVANMSKMFKDINVLIGGLENWNVSNVTNMSQMFENYNEDEYYVGSFFSFAKWDVSNVTNMHAMFSGNYRPKGLEDWNVSNVRDMSFMFYDAKYFNDAIGNWDVSNVTNMKAMFAGEGAYSEEYAYMSFNQPIGNWNVSNITNMEGMFWDSTAFNQDISGWDVSNVQAYKYFAADSALDDAYNPFIK